MNLLPLWWGYPSRVDPSRAYPKHSDQLDKTGCVT